jgi:hypothetical protein
VTEDPVLIRITAAIEIIVRLRRVGNIDTSQQLGLWRIVAPRDVNDQSGFAEDCEGETGSQDLAALAGSL